MGDTVVVDANWARESLWITIPGALAAVLVASLRSQIDQATFSTPYIGDLILIGAILAAVGLAVGSLYLFGVHRVRLEDGGITFEFARRTAFLRWNDIEIVQPPYVMGVGLYSRSIGFSADVNPVTKRQASAILTDARFPKRELNAKLRRAIGLLDA
jgi:hypothetical protein